MFGIKVHTVFENSHKTTHQFLQSCVTIIITRSDSYTPNTKTCVVPSIEKSRTKINIFTARVATSKSETFSMS